MENDVILEINGLSKNFGKVEALNDVSVTLKRGEILCICGENGAGKSTLIKILSGAETPSSGTIIYEGEEIRFQSPDHAHRMGISTVYQEMVQIPEMSIAENIYLGRYKKRFGLIDFNDAVVRTRELMKRIGLTLDPNTKIKDLSLAKRQLVEILKAISYESKIVIFDEPTSSLSEEETQILMDVIFKLKEAGVSIIYISHRLNEIFRISDRITVLRDGRVAGTVLSSESNIDEIIWLMVGRNLEQQFPKEYAELGETVLEVKNLSGGIVYDCSFSLRAGEVLGFGGLVGAGRSELMELIYGARRYDSGSITYHGRDLKKISPLKAIESKISLVPEDRRRQGLISILPIRQNISLSYLKELSRYGFMKLKKESRATEDIFDKLHIRAPSVRTLVNKLSGGNQQKVVLARSLITSPDILILDEPTRGIDVGTKVEIYEMINQLAASGVAIILISSDLPELLAMSDRIVVMKEGTITGELTGADMNETTFMKLATLGEEVHDSRISS
ncbi:MAG: sugar ABC transporter ATP-binding protein [Saccharofermentanales bacterium]|jgi:ABC-type sugar transport system ATPase subunit|nr:sugar ABC transporter ATP-binding protein [Clostridiaceae bacterium]